MSENSKNQANQPGECQKKRKIRGKLHIKEEACKGCGFCIAFCPSHTLAFSSEFNQKGYHPPVIVDETLCTACGLCGMYCPDFAIYATKVTEKSFLNNDHDDEIHHGDVKIQP